MDPSIAAAGADWNVVVTLAEQSFREGVRLLGKGGKIKRTHYYNVLGMKVERVDAFLADFTAAVAATPGILNLVSHVVPLQQTFDFSTTEEFEERARSVALAWLSKLSGVSLSIWLVVRAGGAKRWTISCVTLIRMTLTRAASLR